MIKYRFFYQLCSFYSRVSGYASAFFICHFLYFFININEIFPIRLEKYLILFYPLFILVFLLLGLIYLFRESGSLIVFLENNFNLNFELLNIYAEQNREGGGDIKPKLQDIIKRLNFSKFFRLFFSPKLTVNVLLLLCLIFFHLFAVNYTKSFFVNLKSIIFYKDKNIKFNYPASLKEGENYNFSFLGYDKSIKIFWRINQKTGSKIMLPEEVFLLSNITADLHLNAFIHEGRYKKGYDLTTVVHKRPLLVSISSTAVNPLSGRKAVFQGLNEIKVLPGSKIETVLTVQPDQHIKKVLFMPDKKGDFDPLVSGNRITLNFTIKKARRLNFKFINKFNLKSKNTYVLKYNLIPNLKPVIRIVSPQSPLTLQKKDNIPVQFSAEDDHGLKKITLYADFFSPYLKEKYNSVIIPYTFNARNNSLKQLLDSLTLKLKEHDFLPGNFAAYYFSVKDFFNLRSYSTTNIIRYLSLSEIYDLNNKQVGSIAEEIKFHLSDARELDQEFKKLKIAGEKGELQKKTISSFKNKLNSFKERLKNTAAKLNRTTENFSKSPEMFSDEIIEKLKEIKKQLDKIDKNFLRKLSANMNALMTKVKLNKSDVRNFLDNIKSENMSERLDNVLKSIKNLQEIQKMNSLEQMAETIFQKYEDLHAFSVYKKDYSIFNSQKKEITQDLKDLIKKYNEIKNSLNNNDPEMKKVKEELDQLLNNQLAKDMENYQANDSNSEQMKKFSETLDKIRKNISMMARRSQQLDLEKTLAELDSQITGFSFQNYIMENYSDVYDLEITGSGLLVTKFGFFLTEITFLTEKSRENLYNLIAGYIPGIISFFKIYDKLVRANKGVQKELDPASGHYRRKRININQITLSRSAAYRDLIISLIHLKEFLLMQQDQNDMQSKMNSLSQMQSRLNGRTNPLTGMSGQQQLTQQQLDYLKQSAMEQAFLRSLMESMQQSAQGRKRKSQKNGERTGRSEESGMLKNLENIIKEMAEVENGLKKYSAKNAQRIITKQKNIETNLLKFNKGLKKKSSEKEKEREAQRPKREFEGYQKVLLEKYLYLQKKYDSLKRANKLPLEYQIRILQYLNQLETLLK